MGNEELGGQDSWVCHLLSSPFLPPGFPAPPEEEVFGLKREKEACPPPDQGSFGQIPPGVEAAWPELSGGGHGERAVGQALGAQKAVYSGKTHRAVVR